MSSIKPVVQSALARVLSFLPTAVATLFISRLIIQHFGISTFDSFALIVALIAVLPLSNLGVGAAITSAYAGEGPHAEHSRRVTLTAARVLTVSTIGTLVGSALLTVGETWPTLLGAASGPNVLTGVAVAVYSLSFLPGLGQSMLLGINRNHVTVLIQTFFAPLMLVITAVLVLTDVNGDYVVLIPAAAMVVINLVTAWVAARETKVGWSQVIRAVPFRRRHPGASIRALSGPLLIINLALPIALQSDRIVLSHVSSQQAVANYSVAILIFAPVAALIAASAQPLWPIYATARSAGQTGPKLGKVLFLFCGAAILVCALLVLVADPVGQLVGGGHIDLGWLLPISSGLAVVVQAAAYPLAMHLMDPAGVKFVSICTVLALPLNLALSVVLAQHIGAPGPLLATFAVTLLVQTIPALIYSRRRRLAGRHRYDPKRAPDALTVQAISAMTGIPLSIPAPSTVDIGTLLDR
jgi:O-antigen/teichoic acid export membrane protein